MLMAAQGTYGQTYILRSRTDTLSIGQRLSVHTNVVDWAMLVPNIGLEFDLRGTNWNRHAIGVGVKSRWRTPSTFAQKRMYSITDVRLYWRNYWRTRPLDRPFVDRHHSLAGKLLSMRRTQPKHPRTTYYRGIYASYSDIAYRLSSKDGHRGFVVSAGMTYGIIRPMLAFAGGTSLDIDLGLDLGLVATHTERFKVQDNQYMASGPSAKWRVKPYPLPTEIRVGMVYRIGRRQVLGKYRWRYDVDAKFQDALHERYLAEEKARRDQHNADSINQLIFRDFQTRYDSIAAEGARRTPIITKTKKKRKQ